LLFGGLLKIPNIANFNLWCETELKIKKGWVGRVRKLQDKLNNYVHSNGERYAPLKSQGWEPGWGAYNIALPFRVDKLEEWMEMYRQVVREVAIAHILLYPIALSGVDIRGKFSSFDPAQGTLGAGQSARLMTILPRREVQYLNQIAEQDVCTKQFLAYVEALPIISKRDDREVHEFLSRKFGESDKGRRYDGWCRQKVAHLGSPSLMTVIFGSAPNNYAVRRAWVEKYAHEYTQMDEVKHLWPPPFEAKD
jgi:hypothetical protein